MNKKEKSKRLNDFADYLNLGIEEAGKDNNLNVQSNTFISEKKGKLPDSVFVLQSFAQKLSYRKDYSIITFRVLFHFLALSQFENFVSIDVKTISDNLEIGEASVKRATKQLFDDRIIVKIPHPSDKRRIDYFINPMAAWRGKSLKRDKFLEQNKNQLRLNLDMFPED